MINNSNKYIRLQKTFQTFFYDGFDYDLNNNELSVVYHFRVDDFVEFHPSLKWIKSPFYQFEKLRDEDLRHLLFQIGMVELISYWKALVPPKIVIRPYALSQKQRKFWQKLYFHGLGEFFYLNGIEVQENNFVQLESTGNQGLEFIQASLSESLLIPVGGGKDSVVSLELLKNYSSDNLALIMNPRGASLNTVQAAGFGDRLLEIQRTIDPELLRLNKEGYLNGHTPFSALLAFVTLLTAAASGRKYIALSNEGSANEPTVAGTKINHQYSKSLEFEQDFHTYVQENISREIQYFSFLRPLSELQIARIFSKQEHHFPHFRSCNVGSKKDIWCGKCPKCLFTFIILSPFVSPQKLQQIFGANILDDMDLYESFKELNGIAEVKPFECIGTVDEVKTALCLAAKQYDKAPVLLRKFRDYFGDFDCNDEYLTSLLQHLEEPHFVEEKFLQLLKKELGIDA